MDHSGRTGGVVGCADVLVGVSVPLGVTDGGPVELDAPSGSDDGDLGALPVLAIRYFSPDEGSVAE